MMRLQGSINIFVFAQPRSGDKVFLNTKPIQSMHFLGRLLYLLISLLLGSTCHAFSTWPRRSTSIQQPSSSLLWSDTSLSDKSADTEGTFDSKPQTIAVIGSGAMGSYYGARLWQEGQHQVQFYLRPGAAFDESQRKGFQIQSIDGDFVLPPGDLCLINSTFAMDKPNWIILALKTTALAAIPDLILPLLSEKVKILPLMNGMIDHELIRLLKEATGQTDDGELQCCRTLYGGMAMIAANRLSPGEIHHLFGGPISVGIASTQTSAKIAKQELLSLWEPIKTVECNWEDSLRLGRYRKMLWNLPFSGVSVAMGGIPTDEIVQDPGLRILSRRVMEETLAIAVAECGEGALDQSHIEGMYTFTDSMGSYRPSTMIDLLERRPMEVEYLFRQPLQRAQALGVDTPYLFTIVTMIEALQRKYDLY
eukprot:scaffold10892_cov163-Amphora_coffeaeformis.AAC.9